MNGGDKLISKNATYKQEINTENFTVFNKGRTIMVTDWLTLQFITDGNGVNSGFNISYIIKKQGKVTVELH